ncbi:MAG TPA: hypothetical protein VK629_09305, partial [Steroidobacteraceae bacterium]|nr:hypothetical protein [Steroidobacteraceae bacterium]
TALVNYGGVVSARTNRHYSLIRIAWEALQHDDPGCNVPKLTYAFKHPGPLVPVWTYGTNGIRSKLRRQ